jgi:hypothetical protein
MAKKVLIIFLMFLLLFPICALANDGGAMLDDDKYLSVDVKLDSKKAEIGGDISLTVSLMNKSKDLIKFMNITQIFKGDDVYENDTYRDNIYDVRLQPGEKLKLELKATVPITNIFYKQDDKYYTNVDFNILYDLLPIDATKDLEERHWFYENKIVSIPIEITNIYDGTELLKLEILEEETTFFFPEYQSYELNHYNVELLSDLNNKLVITNMTDKLITNLFIRDLKDRNYNDRSVLSVSGEESIEVDIYYSHFIPPDKLTKTLPVILRASFKVNNKYYTTQITKEYPSKVLNCPILDVALKDNNVVISNFSDSDITGLYIDLDSNNTYSFKYYEQNKIPLLKKDATIKIPYTGNKTIINNYLVGLIRDGKLYYWTVNNTNKSPYYFDGWERNYFHINTIIPTQSPTLKPTQTPSPTQTKNITPKPSQAIEVTIVTKESSMPWWVWIVLTLTIVCSGVIIWRFRHNNKESD